MKTRTKYSDDSDDQIRANVEIHNRISGKYDSRHGEIFNDIEQDRLHGALKLAVSLIRSGSDPLTALDFGCGSGNLTRHLLDLNLNVVASDVSENFLTLVQKRFSSPRLSTMRLNGTDLRGANPGGFDLVAAYSVLHHVPDYLAAVVEMARVCRPGGVIYLDHEPTEGFWTGNSAYSRFQGQALRFDWRKFLVWGNYAGKIRRIFNPRYANEGDIHVWPDDHIEWRRIEDALTAAGCEVAYSEEYLLFRRGYYREIYERHRNEIVDTRVMIFRKL